jgi:GNAT superfamily N-acetyltransferase
MNSMCLPNVKQAIFSAQYTFIRGRQLEGTYPGDRYTGIWPITSNRVGRGWGYVPEEQWPYDTSVWPPVEPLGLDQIAIKNPDFYYQRVRTLEECKSVIRRGQSLVEVSLNISDKWYNVPDGRIPENTVNDIPVGGHSVLVYGFDDSCQEFAFRNSWGVNWGDKGNGRIPYAVFEACWVEGWCGGLAACPMDGNPNSGVAERRWGVHEHGGRVLHCYEFVDSKAGRIAWAFFVERGQSVGVEELFVMPAFRRKGYGAELANMIADHSRQQAASLTVWISHADTSPDNFLIV